MSQLTGETRATVGLIGAGIDHSLSPAIHNAAFAACGMARRYALWPTTPEELPERIESLRRAEMMGANVTIPYKRDVMSLLDALDPGAESAGAINTVVRRPDGALLGINTDGEGFMRALQSLDWQVSGREIVMVGAGGAARAVAHALVAGGVARLTVANRNPEHAEALLADLLAATPHDPELLSLALDDPRLGAILATGDLLINATPIGTDDRALPLPADLLHPRLQVFDMIYRSTPLLRAAEAIGARTADGLPMLIHQAALAWTAWTHLPAPLAVMETAAYAARDGRR